MKNIALLISILLFLASAFHVQAQRTISGPVTINVTAFQRLLFYHPISSRTNQTATTTNIVTVSKSTIATLAITNGFLIDLLANSFRTHFPPDARLFLLQTNALFGTLFTFYVTDSTGTNVLLRPSPFVMSIGSQMPALTGLQTTMTSQTKSGTTVSGNDTELSAALANLVYNDSEIGSADGTVTQFNCAAVLTGKYSQNYATGKTTESFSMSLSGFARIRNEIWTLENGTLTATLAGIVH